jgi:hypothetical protein
MGLRVVPHVERYTENLLFMRISPKFSNFFSELTFQTILGTFILGISLESPCTMTLKSLIQKNETQEQILEPGSFLFRLRVRSLTTRNRWRGGQGLMFRLHVHSSTTQNGWRGGRGLIAGI